MTEYANVDDLVAPVDTAEDFTLSSGKVVRLRGLTRAEHLWVGKGTDDPAEIEARMLSKAFVEPRMTIEQVKAWQKNGVSKIVSEVSDRVQKLSGFDEGAAKSDVPEVRNEP